MINLFKDCVKNTKQIVQFEDSKKDFIVLLSSNCNKQGIPINKVKILIKKDYNFNDKTVTEIIEESYKNKSDFGQQKKKPLEEYLKEKYNFRYNEVLGRIEYRSVNEVEFNVMNDFLLNSLHRELGNKGYGLGIDKLKRLLVSEFVTLYNPFEAYFNNLPKWDGIDYIQELSSNVKTNDTAFWRMALKKWLVAMVACSLEKKTTNHTVIVFSGEQGIGKSTFIGKLLPPELEDYQYSGIINPNNRDTLILMTENIIIDLDELANMNKKEEKELKELITKPSIKTRRPYGRLTETLIRRASFIGSVNDTNFLTDLTGSRRFLCFKVSKFEKNKTLNYQGIYSQAFSLYKDGFRFWFDEKENKEINSKNEQFRIINPIEDIIASKYTSVSKNGQADCFKTSSELLKELTEDFGVQMNTTNSIQLGKILTKLGFIKVKKNGVLKYALKYLSKKKEIKPLKKVS